jgi:serine/threonine protein kinase
MPPEMLEKKPYDFSADVWSCAIVLLEMISGTGKLVFEGLTAEAILNDIKQKVEKVVP